MHTINVADLKSFWRTSQTRDNRYPTRSKQRIQAHNDKINHLASKIPEYPLLSQQNDRRTTIQYPSYVYLNSYRTQRFDLSAPFLYHNPSTKYLHQISSSDWLLLKLETENYLLFCLIVF